MAVVSRTYHHGNLRAALLEEAERALAAGEDLSLRELARRAGVSHAAPRRHFADKQALLDALATDGFERLGRELDAAMSSAVDSDPDEFAGHSLRAGMITSAAEAGVPEWRIMAHSRHTSDVVRRYIRPIEKRKNSPTTEIETLAMANKLTAKQHAFCLAYLETGNATEAYRRAYNAGGMQPARSRSGHPS